MNICFSSTDTAKEDRRQRRGDCSLGNHSRSFFFDNPSLSCDASVVCVCVCVCVWKEINESRDKKNLQSDRQRSRERDRKKERCRMPTGNTSRADPSARRQKIVSSWPRLSSVDSSFFFLLALMSLSLFHTHSHSHAYTLFLVLSPSLSLHSPFL